MTNGGIGECLHRSLVANDGLIELVETRHGSFSVDMHLERPLHANELFRALGIGEGSRDMNIGDIPAIETLLSCTLGLVTLGIVTVEKSLATVLLVHSTLHVQVYLTHNPNLFNKPHSMIAEVCLTHLNFRQVSGVFPTVCLVPPTIPFVDYRYASYY